MSMQLSGGEMLIRALEDEDTTTIYGYPGGAALHIYDALFKSEKIRHILVRHEQAATHMADGYARATNKPGVVLVTSGPGATNTVTGIATAYMDSVPMIVICGQVSSEMIGMDAFQETDIVGVSRPVVKHSFAIKHPTEIPNTIKKAFYIACTGKPGPVLIDIPKDMTDPKIRFPYLYPETVRVRSYKPTVHGNVKQIHKTAKLLLAARQPIIYSGGGVITSGASAMLTKLARLIHAPVTSTLMGLGAFSGIDTQFLGMLGMHGTYAANNAMHHADLIFAVGARFDDRVVNNPDKFCPNATIIHIDIDPSNVAKVIRPDVPIVGDCKNILTELCATLGKLLDVPKTLDDWWCTINTWRREHHLDMHEPSTSDVIKPQDAIKALWRIAQPLDAYITSDVGQHQMFVAQHYPFDKPNRWINSGGLGTMGFGLPAAMGIAEAFPDATVVCVTGEGSIQMNIQELSTCKQYNLPIKIINLNNRLLGMVKQWQDMQYGGRHSHSYMDSLPDFEKLAHAYGHEAITITRLDSLESGLQKAFAMKDRLVFVDIHVDPEEHVYPMQIKGGTVHDLILTKQG